MKQLQTLFLIVAGALIITNPSQEEYLEWVKQQAALSGADGALFSLIGLPIVGSVTTTENCWLFSVYTTSLDSKNTYKTIGLFHSFMPIPRLNSNWVQGTRFASSPHVLASNEQGTWRPEDGYVWVVPPPNGGDFRVSWSVNRKSELHPHLVTAATEGQWLPEDGYTWVVPPPNGGDLRVRWIANRNSSTHPHVVTAPSEGRWLPEDGYMWVIPPPNGGDFRVSWAVNRKSAMHPHVVSAATEGRWMPEGGYMWVANPPVDGDFRVMGVPGRPSDATPHAVEGADEGGQRPNKPSEWAFRPGAPIVSAQPTVTVNQAKASCSIKNGRLFCPSPGAGMCWAAGHSPYRDQTPVAIDVGTDESSPDYDHPERCSGIYSKPQ